MHISRNFIWQIYSIAEHENFIELYHIVSSIRSCSRCERMCPRVGLSPIVSRQSRNPTNFAGSGACRRERSSRLWDTALDGSRFRCWTCATSVWLLHQRTAPDNSYVTTSPRGLAPWRPSRGLLRLRRPWPPPVNFGLRNPPTSFRPGNTGGRRSPSSLGGAAGGTASGGTLYHRPTDRNGRSRVRDRVGHGSWRLENGGGPGLRLGGVCIVELGSCVDNPGLGPRELHHHRQRSVVLSAQRLQRLAAMFQISK
jgi:hypothetical protein